MSGPEDILSYWLDELEPRQWFIASDEIDQQIRDRFQPTWEKAVEGGLGQWLTHASGALGYIILLDQFSRNMFRDSDKAFSSDRRALCAAKLAIHNGWDLRIDEPARMFFYLPLMHSENLCDQDRCVRLIKERMTKGGESQLLHARAHREVIRQFGRFPYRNKVLGRKSTTQESAYVSGGGYGSTVQGLQTQAA